MVNAGALWENGAIVVDGNHVSARTPADLAPFARAMVEWLRGVPDVTSK
jgi:protease I